MPATIVKSADSKRAEYFKTLFGREREKRQQYEQELKILRRAFAEVSDERNRFHAAYVEAATAACGMQRKLEGSTNLPEANNTPALTPEEIEAARAAELDTIHAAQQKADQEIADETAKAQKLREETAELKLKDRFSDARKASGYSFYSATPELIKLVRNEPGFLVNSVEESYFIDGQRVELAEMLRTYAERHAWSRERTAEERAALRGQKESGVRSKEDLKTTAEKSAFVSRYGADAFAALPAHAPLEDSKIQYLTLEEFSKLPTKQKVRFVAKNGQQAVENLRFNKR